MEVHSLASAVVAAVVEERSSFVVVYQVADQESFAFAVVAAVAVSSLPDFVAASELVCFAAALAFY